MDHENDIEKADVNIEEHKKSSSKPKLPRIYLYFIYFLIFAVIGWLLETCFSFYSLGHFTKRGFL